MVKPDVDSYNKPISLENTLKNARKRQPIEHQTNTKTEIYSLPGGDSPLLPLSLTPLLKVKTLQ